MLNIFRLFILAVTVFFLNNFYLETFTYEKFQLARRFKILDVIDYHMKYPAEFLTFFILIIVPAIYYGFIRGVRFYEKGFVFNRGIPFLNRAVLYSEVTTYKLLHPELAISIHVGNGDIYLIADNAVERVIAILDQQNIRGDLAQDGFVRVISNYKKFFFVIICFTIFLFVIKKLGLFN